MLLTVKFYSSITVNSTLQQTENCFGLLTTNNQQVSFLKRRISKIYKFKSQLTTSIPYGYFSLQCINNNNNNNLNINFVIECFAATNPPFKYLFLNENFAKINQILNGEEVFFKNMLK